jgi:hypothetical protein
MFASWTRSNLLGRRFEERSLLATQEKRRAESEVEKGSTFRFSLPLARADDMLGDAVLERAIRYAKSQAGK